MSDDASKMRADSNVRVEPNRISRHIPRLRFRDKSALLGASQNCGGGIYELGHPKIYRELPSAPNKMKIMVHCICI